MEDLSISKVSPATGFERVVHNKDGDIVVIFRGDMILLRPHLGAKQSVSNKLTDHFTIQRLTGSLNKNDNVLRNYLALESHRVIGEARPHNSANGIKITSVSVSDSGISKTRGCMMLLVTDTLNGLLVKFAEGTIITVCAINSETAKIDKINTEKVMSALSLNRLRIRSLVWLKGLRYEHINSKIWPMIPGSLFVAVCQCNTCHIYQFNEETESVDRALEFSLGVGEEEWGLQCEVSDWDYSMFAQTSQIHSFITFVTNKNRIITKRAVYTLKSNEISVYDVSQEAPLDPIVANQLVSCKNDTLLVTIYATRVRVCGLASGLNCSVEVNTPILVESLVHFADCQNENIVHIVFTNTFGYLGHIRVKLAESQCELNEHNYFTGISDDSLPLFLKLNKINSENKEKYVVDTLATDPTHTLLEFTYYPVNFTTKLDTSSVKRDPVMFAVVKTQKEAHPDYEDVSLFNSLQTSPAYVQSLSQLHNELSNADGMLQQTIADPKVKLENGDGDGDADATAVTETSDPKKAIDPNPSTHYSGISQAMFLSPDLEKLRINSSKHGMVLTGETKLQVLKRLARQVVCMVQAGELQTNSEQDMFMFLQYCTLLGENRTPEYISALPVEGMDVNETFCSGQFTFPHHEGLPRTIMSLEDHAWSVCETTMLPILTSSVRTCTNCRSKCVASAPGLLCSAVLGAAPICIYCGGRLV